MPAAVTAPTTPGVVVAAVAVPAKAGAVPATAGAVVEELPASSPPQAAAVKAAARATAIAPTVRVDMRRNLLRGRGHGQGLPGRQTAQRSFAANGVGPGSARGRRSG